MLSAFMNIYVTSHAKHVVLLNNMQWLPADQQKQVRDIERKIVRIFRDLVSQIRPDLNEKTRLGITMSLIGSINWTYIWFKDNGALSATDFADLAAGLFLDGIWKMHD
jgi:TetR/AcrR family transcriptional regulator